MSTDDLKDQAEELLNKAKDALSSDKAEEISDAVLDKAAEAAKKVLGDDRAAQIDQVKNTIDDKIGK